MIFLKTIFADLINYNSIFLILKLCHFIIIHLDYFSKFCCWRFLFDF